MQLHRWTWQNFDAAAGNSTVSLPYKAMSFRICIRGSLVLQLYREVRLDLLSGFNGLLKNLIELIIVGLQCKFLQHEVHLRILHAIHLLDGVLYLRCTVCAINVTLEFLLHDGPFLTALRRSI